MRNPLQAVLNKTPIPYSADSSSGGGLFGFIGNKKDRSYALTTTAATSTMFSIVNKTSTTTAAVEWHMHRMRQRSAGNAVCPVCECPGVTLVEDHLALRIWNKPNDFYSRNRLVEAGQQHQDLTGETWLVVERNEALRSIPLGLWPVRPDRIEVVPGRENFIAGYVYKGPKGERIPLELDELLCIITPDPDDPYRGLGPVSALLRDIDSAKFSSEYNRNFFLNSAEPGGIIEFPTSLGDTEFETLKRRWNDQHKGVSRAHRVALLEKGKYVERKYSMKDMQFVELRQLSRDVMMEAYGISKFALGILDDVNRASADAAKAWFAENLTVPRLDRWKAMLNNHFLPLFGETGVGVEFVYSNPVPPDSETEIKERDSKTTAYKTLRDAGVDPDDASDVVGLPRMRVEVKAAPEPAVPAPEEATSNTHHHHYYNSPFRNAEKDLDPDDIPDLSGLLKLVNKKLESLMDDWDAVSARQQENLVGDIRRVLDAGDYDKLIDVEVDTQEAYELLLSAIEEVADKAADQVVKEAAEQGVEIDPKTPGRETLSQSARMTARLLGDELKVSAMRAVQRAGGDKADVDDVEKAVAAHLKSLSKAGVEQQFGGALHGTVNSSRISTLMKAPEGAIYASEKNDKNTCKPCRQVNGRWLGNISDMDQILLSYPDGAFGGYVDCEGRSRCRGTIFGVWRPEQTNKGGGK